MTQAPRIIVVGCGSLGAHLVERIAKKGWQVAVIDRNADAFASLPNSFPAPRFVGDPMELRVMEQASASEAQLVVATTPDDNLNLAIGITAKRVFGVEHAIARVFDIERPTSLAELGVDTVCPTLLETAVVVRRVGQVSRTSGLPVLVAGCGRLGSHLANSLGSAGHRVIVVDNRPSSFDRLDRAFGGRRVAGDATDPAVLERAGAKEVGLGIVAIRDDNVSLMVARVGKRVFGLEKLLARVHDPRREATFEGVDTLSSTVISADAVMRVLERLVGTER